MCGGNCNVCNIPPHTIHQFHALPMVFIFVGGSWTIILVPGGASRVWFQSKDKFRIVSDDRRGLIFYGHIIFKVVVSKVSRQHHRCIGNFCSELQIPTIKWFLNVPIDFSVVFGMVNIWWGKLEANIVVADIINFACCEWVFFADVVKLVNIKQEFFVQSW